MASKVSSTKLVQSIFIFSSTQKLLPPKKEISAQKECSYKSIPKISLESCNYIMRKDFKEIESQCSPEQQSCSEMQNNECFNTQNNVGRESENILTKYHQTESNNIFKNIIKSFIKMVDQQKDQQMQQYYLQLVEYHGSYESLRKIIKNKLKQKKFRWNFKIISLVKSSKYKKLFKYFLVNIDSLWLDGSKVERKKDHQHYAEFLIKTIDDPLLTNEIIYYRKK